jgi:hypothetical protein
MKISESIEQYLHENAIKVDNFINDLLKQKKPGILYEAILHIINSGGKRLRPYLVLKSCEIVGGDLSVAIPFAAALEMLHNFTKRPEEARDFFLKYQDRIIFGTDFAPGGLPSRIWVVRNFLETDEEFHVPTDERLFWPDHRTMIRGLALPREVLDKIYAGNFRRVAGPEPRKLGPGGVIEELDRLTALQDALGASRNTARRVATRLCDESAEGGWTTPYVGRTL